MSLHLAPELLTAEEAIVWLEDISRFDYVREHFDWYSSRRQRPRFLGGGRTGLRFLLPAASGQEKRHGEKDH